MGRRFNERGEIINAGNGTGGSGGGTGGSNLPIVPILAVIGLVCVVCAAIVVLPSLFNPPNTSSGQGQTDNNDFVAAPNQNQDSSSSQEDGDNSTQPRATKSPAPQRPTRTSAPTEDPTDEIFALIRAYDQARRRALETLDPSGLDDYAKGNAYQDRLDAIEMHNNAGCAWEYDFRSIEFSNIDFGGSDYAEVLAILDLDGSIFCGGVERREWAFWGPCDINYEVEAYGNRWYVVDVTTLSCRQDCTGDCD